MTNENIIKQLKRLIPSLQYADDVNAVKGAIQALSQEPCRYWQNGKCNGNTEVCDDAISRDAVDKYIARLLSGYLYDGERERLEIFSAYLWELPPVTPKPIECEDAISRQAVLALVADYDLSMGQVVKCIHALPSVTQKSAKDYLDMADRKAKKIKDALTVTQKSGKWITTNDPCKDLFKKAMASLDFANWVADEIFDDMWEYNKDAFVEIACRKLSKLGIVVRMGDEWELVEPQESEVRNDKRL